MRLDSRSGAAKQPALAIYPVLGRPSAASLLCRHGDGLVARLVSTDDTTTRGPNGPETKSCRHLNIATEHESTTSNMAVATLVRQAVSGAAFGAALSLSGVWLPSVVLGQMHLQDFRMLQMFLSASGASILLLNILSARGLVKTSPRSPSPIAGVLGGASTYAGNIIGGLMQGLGMVLAGACASTVVVQAGLGIYPGLYTITGAAFGGFLFVPVNSWIQARNGAVPSAARPTPKLTIYEHLGLSCGACIVLVELVFASLITVLTRHQAKINRVSGVADRAFLDPIVGGLLVAGAQAVAMFTRGSPLGVSNVFEEVGNMMWAAVGRGTSGSGKKLSMTGLAFAGGIAGAAAVTMGGVLAGLGDSDVAAMAHRSPTRLRAIVGGVMIGLGSRVSGGCTSGHGISGLSLLSTSSLVTTACMFLGGLVFAQLL
ncbi:YeeE/YedE family protein [Microdochium nivale]|nr:YeeE/YedE family protein [Microdochium nivale]